jgi:hypothetical protein
MNAATRSIVEFLTACGRNTNAEARKYLATTDVEAEMDSAGWTVPAGRIDWQAIDHAIGADVTASDIEALGNEAAEAGDLEMCAIVALALGGNAAARERCIDAIVANR